MPPKDYAALEPTNVRRRDREITDETWIETFLATAAFGHMATLHDGQPFINSNLFAYDGERRCIYIHTASVGRTRANVERNERVCFTVSEMGRLLPAAEALEFSVEYAGVVVFGSARLVEGDEAERGLQLLLDKYAPHLRPGRDYRPIQHEERKRTAVYRIDVERWTGKRKLAPAEFPGAFPYVPPSTPLE